MKAKLGFYRTCLNCSFENHELQTLLWDGGSDDIFDEQNFDEDDLKKILNLLHDYENIKCEKCNSKRFKFDVQYINDILLSTLEKDDEQINEQIVYSPTEKMWHRLIKSENRILKITLKTGEVKICKIIGIETSIITRDITYNAKTYSSYLKSDSEEDDDFDEDEFDDDFSDETNDIREAIELGNCSFDFIELTDIELVEIYE